jgi:integrase
MSKIMRSAVETGLLKTNPCTTVRFPRIERTEMRFLSPPEVVRLADAIHPRYRAVVFLGAYGGLRAGELFGLRVDRLDLVNRHVDVMEQVVEVSGYLHFGPPKTRAGRRRVSLPSVVTDALTAHLEAYPSAEFVFTGPDSGTVRSNAWRQRFWLPAIKKAEVAPFRIHDLRHPAVALWIAAGASPREIASRAGHSSVSVVLDRYGHLLPGTEERVNEVLDRLADVAAAKAADSKRPVRMRNHRRNHRIARARIAHAGRHGHRAKTQKGSPPANSEWGERGIGGGTTPKPGTEGGTREPASRRGGTPRLGLGVNGPVRHSR